jgi:hypothetical protein
MAVCGLTVLAVAATATAAPKVTLRGRAIKIPGFPGTGNILGAGAAVEGEVTISGTEYGGFPPPLIGAKVYLPKGTKITPNGFPVCPLQTLVEEKEPERCPKGSKAGPVGHAEGFVVFGTERVSETVSIEPFYVPGGGIDFFADGHDPASIEIVSTGRIVSLNGGGGFGPIGEATVPLIQTVPGAAYASTERITLSLGTAIKKGKRTLYYGRVPTSCPKGGFPVKAELTFAENGDLQTPVTVTAFFKAPCPPRSHKKTKHKKH